MADNNTGNTGTGASGEQKKEEGKYLKWLDELNTTLEGLNTWLDGVFKELDRYSQDGVDAICKRVSDVVNYYVNYIKARALNALHEQYLGQLLIIKKLQPAVDLVNGEAITDPKKLFDALVEIFKPWLGPYETAVNFMKELIPKLEKFAENIQKIATYQPTVSIPDIDFDSFKLDITIPTIDQVIAGEVPYPDPPEAFKPPTPIKLKKDDKKTPADGTKVSGTSDQEGLA